MIGEGYLIAGHVGVRSKIAPPSRLADVHLLELVALVCLYGFYSLYGIGSDYDGANIAGAIAFTLILGGGALRLAVGRRTALITAPFWFRVTAAVYFGIGNVVPYVENADTANFVGHFFPVTSASLIELNRLNCICALIALSIMAAAERLIGRRNVPSQQIEFPKNIGRAGILMAAAGLGIKTLVILPSLGATLDSGVLPGILLQATQLTPLGVLLLTIWCLQSHRNSLLVLPLLIVVADGFTGILVGYKSDAILSTLTFLLAFILLKPTIFRLMMSCVLLVSVFYYVVPLTNYVRTVMVRGYGDLTHAPVSERLQFVDQYLRGERLPEEFDMQSGLARISYASAAGFALNRWDSGLPGDSYEDALIVLVPRFLWPEKPIVSNQGFEFNALATGSADSSSSPGLFAEAYWNGGWAAVAIVMSLLGFAIWAVGRYGEWVLTTGRWWCLPLAFLGMRVGLRIDGAVVVDVIGPLGLIAVLQSALFLTDSGFRNSRNRRIKVSPSNVARLPRSGLPRRVA